MAAETIDISGLNKATLMIELFRNQEVSQGAARFGPFPDPTRAEAGQASKGYTDYLCGRVIKCDISGDAADYHMYDRDAGEGTFQRVVDKMRPQS